MRILLIWPSADFSTKDVAEGIRAGLIEEGHEVVDYRLGRRLTMARWAVMRERTEDPTAPVDLAEICLAASEGIPYKAAVHDCDWALVVHGVGLHAAALVGLRKIGVRVAWWFTEAPYESNEDREIHQTQFVDVAFVNERTAVGAFQAALDRAGTGGRAHYLRHAFDPAVHFPRPPEEVAPEDRSDVLMIGTGFAERQHLFECCDWTGIDLKLGGVWAGVQPNHRLREHIRWGPLPNAETARLYAGAKIVVNCHRDGENAESANPRVWEAAACGAFQISDARAEIADVLGEAVPLYPPGVPWRFITLIRRYLADEPERLRLATLALERVQGETFRARARTVVDALTDFDRSRQPERRVVEVT